jgi:hypothetical protein
VKTKFLWKLQSLVEDAWVVVVLLTIVVGFLFTSR